MSIPDINSGLELRIDHRGRGRLFFNDRAIPGQMGCGIELPFIESGTLNIELTMRAIKIVHLPKPKEVPS